jgi:hypothetical protein
MPDLVPFEVDSIAYIRSLEDDGFGALQILYLEGVRSLALRIRLYVL